jgi:hypothetical protein
MSLYATFTLTVVAAADIAANAPVGYDNAPASAGEPVRGFAAHAAVAGQPLTINISGIVTAVAATHITAGQSLAVGADGDVQPVGSGQAVIGTAWTSATTGGLVQILLAGAPATEGLPPGAALQGYWAEPPDGYVFADGAIVQGYDRGDLLSMTVSQFVNGLPDWRSADPAELATVEGSADAAPGVFRQVCQTANGYLVVTANTGGSFVQADLYPAGGRGAVPFTLDITAYLNDSFSGLADLSLTKLGFFKLVNWSQNENNEWTGQLHVYYETDAGVCRKAVFSKVPGQPMAASAPTTLTPLGGASINFDGANLSSLVHDDDASGHTLLIARSTGVLGVNPAGELFNVQTVDSPFNMMDMAARILAVSPTGKVLFLQTQPDPNNFGALGRYLRVAQLNYDATAKTVTYEDITEVPWSPGGPFSVTVQATPVSAVWDASANAFVVSDPEGLHFVSAQGAYRQVAGPHPRLEGLFGYAAGLALSQDWVNTRSWLHYCVRVGRDSAAGRYIIEHGGNGAGMSAFVSVGALISRCQKTVIKL